MSLPRTIENPDGIAFTDNGSLIVLEGAVNSGNGKVLDSGFMALRLDPSVYLPRSRTAANPHHNHCCPTATSVSPRTWPPITNKR